MSVAEITHTRVWLQDERLPDRRMQVTHHPEYRMVIISFWQANICTATFRLPVEQAPSVINALVEALADAALNPQPKRTVPVRAREPSGALLGSWRRRVSQLGTSMIERLLSSFRGGSDV